MIDLSLSFSDAGENLLVRTSGPEIGEAPEPLPPSSKERLRLLAAAAPAALAPFSDARVLEQLGRRLFDELFQGPNRDLYMRARALAKEREGLLRLQMGLSPESEWTTLPYEVMHDGKRFLAEEARTCIVRYLEGDQGLQTLAVQPPLRILFTAALPSGHPTIDVEAEEEALAQAYAPLAELVDITPYRHLTRLELEEIFRQVRQGAPAFHVWHHCGHGGLADGIRGSEFRLYLESGGASSYVTTDQLRVMIGAESQLRAAVLAVCYAGSPGALAPELARLNVPAVIGFPIRIEGGAIDQFSKVLHSHLARLPVEQAMSEARTALISRDPSSREWCQAYLFSRRSDCGPLLIQPGRSSGALAGEQSGGSRRGKRLKVRQVVERNDVRSLDVIGVSGAGQVKGPLALDVCQEIGENVASELRAVGVDCSNILRHAKVRPSRK